MAKTRTAEIKTCGECGEKYKKWRNDVYASRCRGCQRELDRTNPLDHIDDGIDNDGE